MKGGSMSMVAIGRGLSAVGEKISTAASRAAATKIAQKIASNPGVNYFTRNIGKTVAEYEKTGPKDLSVCYKLLKRLLSLNPVTQGEIQEILGNIPAPMREAWSGITAKLGGSTIMASIFDVSGKFPKDTEALKQAIEIMSNNIRQLAK